MSKWIFILKLLGTDIETGEIEWHTAIYQPGFSSETCIEMVVDTHITLTEARVRHEVYCKEMPKEIKEEENEK